MDSIKKNLIKTFIFITIIILFTLFVLYIMDYYNLIPKEYYKASDFDIKTIYSQSDYNHNGIDDYTDIVLGARKDANNQPTYISKYYDNSYPPDNEGVCTDVIWRAFKNAGYSLRDMVNNDIKNNPEDYPHITNRDINIDFRRVNNLEIFFNKYAISDLSLDSKDIADWQPGDIVIFDHKHIGIISDRRNKQGIPYIIHNYGQPKREEDYLTKGTITNHYRFDATKIPEDILISWEEQEWKK